MKKLLYLVVFVLGIVAGSLISDILWIGLLSAGLQAKADTALESYGNKRPGLDMILFPAPTGRVM